VGCDPDVTKKSANPRPDILAIPASMTLRKVKPIFVMGVFAVTVSGYKSRIDPVWAPLKLTPKPRVS
jgi:hypothetical protein